MNKLKAAVLPSKGIGDALLMMIASENLRNSGYEVITFHSKLAELSPWFKDHTFLPLPSLDQWQQAFSDFHLIIAQNDNFSKMHLLKTHFRSRLSIFYPSHQKLKYGEMNPKDQLFSKHVPMAENIALACATLLDLKNISKNNGLSPHVPELVHRKYQKRVVIHPTSSLKEKNWHPTRFLHLAHSLKQADWDPIFVVSNEEKSNWQKHLGKKSFSLCTFSSLSDLASYLYESGLFIGNDSFMGHLASNMDIPNIIIADNAYRMRLWRPGWRLGEVVTPPRWIPNIKFLRLREKYWKFWITHQRVFSATSRCSGF